MLNYYCLTIIGNVSGVDEFLGRISNNKQNSLILHGLTIFTFETLYDIQFIEASMIGKNFLLSKMNDLSSFTAQITDITAHNHLFGDYMEQKIKDEMDKFKEELKKDLENEGDYTDFEESQSEEDGDELKKWMKDLHLDNANPFHKKNVVNERINKVEIKLTLDEILDKITRCGYTNLSLEEKGLLDKYSKS